MNIIGVLGNAGSGKDTVGKMIAAITDGATLALADPLKELAQEVFGFTASQLWGPSELRNTPDLRFSADTDRRWWARMLHRLRGEYYAPAERQANWEIAREQLYTWGMSWLEEVLPDVEPKVAFQALVRWFDGLPREEVLTPRLVLQTLGTEFGRDLDPDVWIKVGLSRARALLSGDAPLPMVVITDVRFLNEASMIRELGGQVWRIHRKDLKALEAGVQGHRSEEEQKSKEMDKYVSLELNNVGTRGDLFKNVKLALQNTGVDVA